MNIDESVYKNTNKSICNLRSGDVFVDSDGTLMMYLGCLETTVDDFKFNAVTLETGDIVYISHTEQITPMPHVKIVLD